MTKEEQLKEINEAIYAGNNALAALNEAISHLSGARGFGIWDMLGGGLVSGLLKHSQMDKAQDCVNRANMAMQSFQRELQDVNMHINYGVQFDGMTKAIDILFDNFLVDALIQSRIKETADNLNQSKYQVEQALGKLQYMKANL